MIGTHKLTIGIPVFDDFDGVYFTMQAIRMYHAEALEDVEFVIVDNHPDGDHGRAVKKFSEWIKEPVRYVPLTDRQGAACAKEAVFGVAETPYVLCLDCHVLLAPGALRKLIEALDSGCDEGGLLHGPLVYDNLASTATHFALVWRGGMWGIWASAWRCTCGEPFQVRALKTDQGDALGFQSLMAPHDGLSACEACGKRFPEGVAWACHEAKLCALGFVSASDDPRPFEIPAQGMGVFACRRDAWLGFNPRFRGFGGEECYIHEKYRRAGRKTLCLPFLKWVHRFGRPGGVPYKPVWEDRIFNYLVGHAELGIDPSPVIEHFRSIVPAQNLERVMNEALGMS